MRFFPTRSCVVHTYTWTECAIGLILLMFGWTEQVEAHVCQVFMCVGLPLTLDPPPSSPPFFRSSTSASLPWTCSTLAPHQSLFPLRYSFLLPSTPHHTAPSSSVVLASRFPHPSSSIIPLAQSLHEPLLRTTLLLPRTYFLSELTQSCNPL